MLRIRVNPGRSAPERVYYHPVGPFLIGRAPPGDGPAQCVLSDDLYISRTHVRLEERPDGRVSVTNVSQRNPLLAGGELLDPGKTVVLATPAALTVGQASVVIEPGADDRPTDDITYSSLGPAHASVPELADIAGAADPVAVGRWFEALIAVQRAAAGSDEFYQQTARALVDLIGLHVGLVLLRKGGRWAVVARAADRIVPPGLGREFSVTVLDRMSATRQTLYDTGQQTAQAQSLADVEALVASPVADPAGEVVGALYGVKWGAERRRAGGAGVTPLEAQMVQVLATAVGVGLARVEQEAEAARMRVQFRQYFTDQLARELEADAGRLDGQDREATFLFADIRGFSRHSERLGPRDTFRLVSGVMEALTEAVHRHNGVVMDYVGDELIALWNAPADQPDHPRLAVACAASIPAALAPLADAWRDALAAPLAVGVGINTGTARVGNTGTRYKFKYGALGHAVNVASRIQGATKAFGVPVLLSAATRARVADDAPVRRLGRVRVVGIREPVELYELAAEPAPDWYFLRAGYENALDLFEAGNPAAAAAALGSMATTPAGRADGPVALLAARVGEALRDPARAADGVIELSQK